MFWKEISTRLQFAKELYVWGWRWVVIVIWGIPYGSAGIYAFLKGQEFVSSELPLLSQIIPNWLPPLWFGIGIVAFLLITSEGSYRIVQQERNKQSSKPKFVFLPNRDRLLTTIAEAKLATVDETENIKNIKLKKRGNFVFQDAGMWDKLDRIQQRFDYACESLERETYTAGSVFEPILKPLFVYMRSAADLDSSTASEYKIKLEEMVMITRNRIEELSQPVPHKEGSLSE